jgi:NAD(P)-dependent dehydrogenase (short-subunit alcohol dehydrogenase family)
MATLNGKTALVTGASRGIGRATAVALTEAGAHVLVHYGRSAREAESLVAEIQKKGNKRDYAAAERFWSPKYVQHSAHIPPGREGLFALVRSTPDTLRYENQVIVAEGECVIAHGRFSGIGRPAAWIAADVVRFEDGLLAEHWDVLQDEATQKQSVSGLPMFGKSFPS